MKKLFDYAKSGESIDVELEEAMKKPEKKKVEDFVWRNAVSYEDMAVGYNLGRKEMKKYYQWLIHKDYISKKECVKCSKRFDLLYDKLPSEEERWRE